MIKSTIVNEVSKIADSTKVKAEWKSTAVFRFDAMRPHGNAGSGSSFGDWLLPGEAAQARYGRTLGPARSASAGRPIRFKAGQRPPEASASLGSHTGGSSATPRPIPGTGSGCTLFYSY